MAASSSRRYAMTAVAAALSIFLALCAIAAPVRAAIGDPIYPTTLVQIYAVGPSQWVRRSATHSTSPVRAADNIAQSQATLFLFEGGPANTPIPLTSGTINLIDAFTMRPYCEPRNGVSGWFDTTLMCWDTSDGPWLRLVTASSTVDTVLNSGDEVYILNMRNSRWCGAPTWPTNNAGLYCNYINVGSDNAVMRFRVYST
nr:hypothetical protein [Pandoravirus aubagnensis]